MWLWLFSHAAVHRSRWPLTELMELPPLPRTPHNAVLLHASAPKVQPIGTLPI